MKKQLTLAFALATFGSVNVFAQETISVDGAKNIMCNMMYKPVCGEKDGSQKTYGNSCTAGAAGAKVLYEGECNMNNIINSLDGNSYKISQLNGNNVTGDYNVSFENGRINAKICNTMNGDYSLEGGKFLVPNMISTRMACIGEPGEIENVFKVDNASYKIDQNSDITLTTKDGTQITLKHQGVVCKDDCGVGRPGYVFNPLEGNNYKISQFNGKAVNGNYSLNFLNGKINAKICNTINGNYNLNGEKIVAPNLITTLMACMGEPGEIENNLKIDGASFSTNKDGNINLTTKDGNIFELEQVSKTSSFDFQGDWKLTSYDGKKINQNIILNFSGDNLSTKICNNFWGKYSLSGENTTYNLTSNLASTRMMCEGELGEIEKNFDLSSAKINLPLDTANHIMIQTSGKNFEFERVAKKPSVYPVPKTNNYINLRATKLLNQLEKYMNQNSISVEDMKTRLSDAIEKINSQDSANIMKKAKLEMTKKVFQATLESLNSL